MKTFQRFLSLTLSCAAAAALVGCASVNLGPDTGAPRVRMPGEAAVQPASAQPTSGYAPAQAIPVAPRGAVAQPLSPMGSADEGAVDAGAPVANAHLVTLTTHMDSASAVPPTVSGATAQLDAVYDSNTHLLRWKATWTNLSSSITAVRFYGPAAQGQIGPATLIWPGPFGQRYEGRATLTPQQAASLMGGMWYVNVHTANYPDGEIRGQLRIVY